MQISFFAFVMMPFNLFYRNFYKTFTSATTLIFRLKYTIETFSVTGSELGCWTLPTFQNLKKSQVHYLACPDHVILLSTLLKKLPRNMFYCAINIKVIKSHLLIMQVRSCKLWRTNLCRQAREQNKVHAIFQILHFHYST